MKHRQNRGPSEADAPPGSSERRLLLQGAAALLATGTALSSHPACAGGSAGDAVSAKAHAGREDSVVALDGRAVVQTGSGSVAGYIHEGIYTFKGIPYAGTATSLRNLRERGGPMMKKRSCLPGMTGYPERTVCA
jgi:hypothetical protein